MNWTSKGGHVTSVAGRLGFSFPLGKISKSGREVDRKSGAELVAINNDITKLQGEVKSRDEQIDALKKTLDGLLKLQSSGGSSIRQPSGTNVQLIATLKARIDQLEREKQMSQAEDNRQNELIKGLSDKLLKQESMFKMMMQQLKSLRSSTKVNASLETSASAE